MTNKKRRLEIRYLLLASVIAITTFPFVSLHAQDQETSVQSSDIDPQVEAQIYGLRARALTALNSGETDVAIKAADAMVRLSPDDTQTMQRAGDIYLRCGKAKWAVRLFDRLIESEPDAEPHLWQRGIALYFMNDHKTGVDQFVRHQKVNPNDVENAAWHFLCLSKLKSPGEAKRRVLDAPNDPRIPMEEVHAMLSSGDTKSVTERVKKTPEGSEARKSAEFYGNFYLGLYADALDEKEKAQSLMKKAAKDAPRNYMGDIARVYSDWLSESD